MWYWHEQKLDSTARQVTLSDCGSKMSFAAVVGEWISNEAFRWFWASSLRDVAFEAYCWELPPLTGELMGRPFECVFIDNPFLAGTAAEPSPFSEHFRRHPDCEVVVFENLGGDATLIAPCPRTNLDVYSHLAAFVRGAPKTQVCAIWRVVAQALETQLGESPVWLSTAGGGVYWLHVRLDSWPKYYRYHPYADSRFWTKP